MTFFTPNLTDKFIASVSASKCSHIQSKKIIIFEHISFYYDYLLLNQWQVYFSVWNIFFFPTLNLLAEIMKCLTLLIPFSKRAFKDLLLYSFSLLQTLFTLLNIIIPLSKRIAQSSWSTGMSCLQQTFFLVFLGAFFPLCLMMKLKLMEPFSD